MRYTDPYGEDCVYTNNYNKDGTVTVERGDCSQKGGTLVNGTIDTNSLTVHNGSLEFGYTDPNGAVGTHSMGLPEAPDPGLLALQRGTQLAEPGVNLAGQGLILFGSIVAPLPMALAQCGAGECDKADLAMAMIPGSGGGKTGRKVGQKAYEAAKESVDLLRRVLARLESTPNKTPAPKEAIRIVEGRLKDALERLRKSEPHGISGQGPGR